MKLTVLFVGNSHTYLHKMPWMVSCLAEAYNRDFSFSPELRTDKRAGLKQHWENWATREKILSNAWDYVVLQDRSEGPLEDPDVFDRYARLWVEEIRGCGSSPIFYMTWAKRSRPQDQAVLTRAYTSAARNLNAGLAPVGTAWQKALENRPDLDLHHSDGRHAGAAGAYLAACVFFAKLFNANPAGLPAEFFIQGKPRVSLDAETALFLQTIAYQAVIKAV